VAWIPKYRKPLLAGPGAIRARDLIRQIAIEHELQIISGPEATAFQTVVVRCLYSGSAHFNHLGL
jgi:hypothetical protein